MFAERKMLLQLTRIADSMELIATWVARTNNLQWTPRSSRAAAKAARSGGDEEAELMTTRDEDILALELQEWNEFAGKGDNAFRS